MREYQSPLARVLGVFSPRVAEEAQIAQANINEWLAENPLARVFKAMGGTDPMQAVGPPIGISGGRMLEVGKDIGQTFLHGTRRSNVARLAAEATDVDKGSSALGGLFRISNPWGAELYLSETSRPAQALMFSRGAGETLATVTLKRGTRVLDLTDEIARAPDIAMKGEPRVVRFFKRPEFVDDMIDWHLRRITPRYKSRNPNWETEIRSALDPSSKAFEPGEWAAVFGRYMRDMGVQVVRLADETLVFDRSAIASARNATRAERAAAEASVHRTPGLYTTEPPKR